MHSGVMANKPSSARPAALSAPLAMIFPAEPTMLSNAPKAIEIARGMRISGAERRSLRRRESTVGYKIPISPTSEMKADGKAAAASMSGR